MANTWEGAGRIAGGPVAPPWALGNGGVAPMIPPELGTEGSDNPAVPSLQIPLPEVLPIPDAKEFNPLASQASAGLETNTVIAGTAFAVPAGYFGVIRGLTLYIVNMLATTNVTWTLQINGAAPQGFSALSIFPRVAPYVGNGFDACIRFTGPALIQVIFTNADGGAYTVGASYSGWFWPQASDARWRRFGR